MSSDPKTPICILPEPWTIFTYQTSTKFPYDLLTFKNEWNITERIASVPVIIKNQTPIGGDVPTGNVDIGCFKVLIKLHPNRTYNSFAKNESGESIIYCDVRVRALEFINPKINYFEIYPGLQGINYVQVSIATQIQSLEQEFLSMYSSYNVDQSTPLENSIQFHKSGPMKKIKCFVIFRDIESMEDKELHNLLPQLKSLLRDSLMSYKIYSKSNTLIDLRHCPLINCSQPRISYVYIAEAFMKVSSAEIGFITLKTEVIVDKVYDVQYFLRISKSLTTIAQNSNEALWGLERPYEILNEALTRQINRETFGNNIPLSQGYLLQGPSGSGKSLLIDEISARFSANLIVFDIGANEHLIRNQLSTVFKKLNTDFKHGICSSETFGYLTIILLENVDLLTNSSSKNEFLSLLSLNKSKIVNYICDQCDIISKKQKLPITIIGTCKKPYLVPDKLRTYGRLSKEIFIQVPNLDQRLGILSKMCSPLAELGNINLENLAQVTPGYVGSDLIRLIHLAVLKAHENERPKVEEVDIKYALSHVLPSVLQGSTGVVEIQRGLALENIAGLDFVKSELIKAIVWPLKHPSAYVRMGIPPPKGILLYGPPGCCKTTIIRAIASSHQTNFLSVTAAELFCSGVGDTEKIIAHLFHRARMGSPCILFIDELDAIVGSRESKSSGAGKRVNESILSMLLTEMDGISGSPVSKPSEGVTVSPGQGVIVVGATNRPEMIDPALLRPGRFDKLIPVPPPNEFERLQLLKNCTVKTPISEDVKLSKIAFETPGYSGADIVNLCKEAALFALSEDINAQQVSMKHYTEALKQSSPTISEHSLNLFENYVKGSQSIEDVELTKKFVTLKL